MTYKTSRKNAWDWKNVWGPRRTPNSEPILQLLCFQALNLSIFVDFHSRDINKIAIALQQFILFFPLRHTFCPIKTYFTGFNFEMFSTWFWNIKWFFFKTKIPGQPDFDMEFFKIASLFFIFNLLLLKLPTTLYQYNWKWATLLVKSKLGMRTVWQKYCTWEQAIWNITILYFEIFSFRHCQYFHLYWHWHPSLVDLGQQNK